MNSINTINRFGVYTTIFPGILSQVRHYAARKGTREKARKKKVKVEVKKLTFQEKVRKSKKITIIKPDALIFKEQEKPTAIDDVYISKYFKWKIYPFTEAIECHREHYHPTMYDVPDSIVNIKVELDMKGVKKTKPVQAFHKIIPMVHKFDHGEDRKLLAFCKADEDVKAALDAGASLAGGSDIIKLILSGEVNLNNYDVVVAHPSIMPEVLTLRGLLKKKHPNIKTGTLGLDIKSMVYTQLYGIKYHAKPYENFPEFGITEVPIGKISMEIEHLEKNMQAAIDSIMTSKPKRPGPFITRIRVSCPPSPETLKIDHTLYIKEEEPVETKRTENEEEDEEEDVAVPVAA